MADNQGKGWHGDPEGHREAAKERDKDTNWWPLLLLPVAFLFGWLGHDAATPDRSDVSSESRFQPGVGAGPDVPSGSPSLSPTVETGQ
jgi:hypothetical protein